MSGDRNGMEMENDIPFVFLARTVTTTIMPHNTIGVQYNIRV